MRRSPTLHPQNASQRFRLEKSTQGDVTLLALHGVIDEGFEGQKVAAGVRTHKLVLDLREVRRFASWGMAEWMSFLRATAHRDLYLVECSAYAVNQINLVTGLLGHGKLISFYSPYRCGRCGEEREQLILVPPDRVSLRALGELAEREQVCGTCGGSAQMDRYPVMMCAALAERASFDIDDEVAEVLRARLGYDVHPRGAKFRAHRRVSKGNVYLRLSGNLAMLPAESLSRASTGTTILDLANVELDPMELLPWRTYVRAALARGTALQLLDCPPGFLEAAVEPSDLQSGLQVRSFALQYHCADCEITASSSVEVARHLEELTSGGVPSMHCPRCQALLVPAGNWSPLLLRQLPARAHDAALDAWLARVRAESSAKLEDCLRARPVRQVRAPGGVYAAAALAALAIGGLLAAGLSGNPRADGRAAPPPQPGPPPPAPPAFERPDWISSDVPSSAFCHDLTTRVVCVGVSSYRAQREAAVSDASDAALEELVNVIGLKISDTAFRDDVLAGYSEARRAALSALQAAETDRASAAYHAADAKVRQARARVVEILRTSGGPAVPAQRSDWYWEEYAAERAGGTEFLGFVRYDVSLDAVKALVDRYSTTVTEGDHAALTAFPGLAWQDQEFVGGAMWTEVGRPLASAGIAPLQIVMAIGEERVSDASGLARRLDAWLRGGGKLMLTVKPLGRPARVIEVRR